MSYKSTFLARILSCLLFTAVLCFASATAASAITNEAPAFTSIQVDEISAPASYENAVRYQISYYTQVGESKLQVFPSYEEKKRDSDLILAQVVRKYLAEQYEAQGKWMDEYCVQESNLGDILTLISNDYLSAAWKSENVNKFRQQIHKTQERLELHTLNIYLDYKVIDQDAECFGMDMNPVILDLGGEKTDTCTIILVNYSDK